MSQLDPSEVLTLVFLFTAVIALACTFIWALVTTNQGGARSLPPPAYRRPPPASTPVYSYVVTDEAPVAPRAAKRGRGGRPSPSDEEILKAFTATGSVIDVVKKLRTSRARVIAVVDAAGLKRKKGAGPLNAISDDVKRAMQEALLSGELSKAAVAKKFNVHPGTVARIARQELQ